jgi:hypothetical protein
MSKLIINKHQICYIPEYNLYLQRVGVDNTSVRHTCERIDLIEHYENENAKVDDLIGDPIFIEG